MERSPSAFIGHGVVVFTTALAVAARAALEPLPEGQLVFFTFYFAVMVSAWYGGTWYGLLATAVGTVCGYVFFSGLHIEAVDHLAAFGFVATGTFMSLLGGRRLEAEAALREALATPGKPVRTVMEHDAVRDILHAMSEGVIATDVEGRVTSLNPAGEALVGSPEHKVLGLDMDEVFRMVNTHTRFAVFNPAKRALREGKPTRLPVHTLLLGTDGKQHPIDASAAPIKDGDGNVTGSVLVFRDITEWRNQEQQMLDKGKQKEDFVATLAHELRNPLAPLTTALQLLEKAPNDARILGEVRPVMVRQVNRLVRLVDDLIDLNRMDRGIVDLHMEEVDMGEVLESVVGMTRPLAISAHHAVVLDLPPDPVYTKGDRERITRIFANLVNHACETTSDHGTITIALERDGEELVVRVKDDGLGVPAEELPHMFSTSTGQASPSGQKRNGIGLGLAVVKQLVDAHGGHISVSSVEGHGTEFVVRLAHTYPQEKPTTIPLVDQAVEPAVRRCVMVVDDNEDTADLLGVLLARSGHDVHVVYDGTSALHEGAMVHPDVVIMDIGMPRMNGYDTARLIRNEEWGQDVQLIAITGWSQERDLAQAKDAGFDHHLVKPVVHEALEQLLVQAERHRAAS